MKKKRSDIYPGQLGIKKYQASGNKTVVVLPSPIAKRDLNDYKYSKDIDEKVLELASKLAEKMAISMIRETMQQNTAQITDSTIDMTVDKIVSKLEKKLPQQQTVVREVIKEGASEARAEVANTEFDFDTSGVQVDRSNDLQLKGKIGEKRKSKSNLDEELDALEDFDF